MIQTHDGDEGLSDRVRMMGKSEERRSTVEQKGWRVDPEISSGGRAMTDRGRESNLEESQG